MPQCDINTGGRGIAVIPNKSLTICEAFIFFVFFALNTAIFILFSPVLYRLIFFEFTFLGKDSEALYAL